MILASKAGQLSEKLYARAQLSFGCNIVFRFLTDIFVHFCAELARKLLQGLLLEPRVSACRNVERPGYPSISAWPRDFKDNLKPGQ